MATCAIVDPAACVFSNDLILGIFFSFLDLENIKILRLVSRQWKAEADRKIGNSFARRIVRPNCTHCNTASYPLPSKLLCKSIKLFSNEQCKCVWRQQDFNQLFQRYASVVKRLTVGSLNLHKIPILLNQTPFLTRLTISLARKYVISAGFLKNIKWLELSYTGIIDVTDLNEKISPEYLHLNAVEFVPKNQNQILNTIFSFSKVKSVYLECIQLKFDMTEALAINSVTLIHVPLANKEIINWNVGNLKLYGCEGILYGKLKLTERKVENLTIATSYKTLSLLPRCVRKLNLRIFGSQYDTIPNVQFPNLFHLAIPFCSQFVNIMALCPKIEILESVRGTRGKAVQMQPLPATVTTLVLDGHTTLAVNNIVQVNNLVLLDYTPENAQQVLNQVQSQHVVVRFKSNTFDATVDTISTTAQTIAYGPAISNAMVYVFKKLNEPVKELSKGNFLKLFP